MPRSILLLVLLVSCSHALVHTYELVFPALEQTVGASWGLKADSTGMLATLWAFPFGFGALAAGWFADRFGSRNALIVYLLGCSVTSLAVAWATGVVTLAVAFFAMGSFASLYHPAGLAYISRAVPPAQLGPALGYHGILGSIGISAAPLLAGVLLWYTNWQGVYGFLVIPGAVLGLALFYWLPSDRPTHAGDAQRDPQDTVDWTSFAVVCVVSMLFGFIYRASMTFLPRYLDGASAPIASLVGDQSARGFLASGVLILGIIGQYAGGLMCARYPQGALLVGCMLLNIPFLLWLGVAEGPGRLWAACGFAIAHFSMQPVQNSLIAKYTPRSRRSLCYGISFMVSFGLGSLGASFAGIWTKKFGIGSAFPPLAMIALAAAAISMAHLMHTHFRSYRRAPA